MLYTIQELYVIKTAPSSAFNALQENVRKVLFITRILRFLLNCHLHVYLRPRPHDAGVIWERRFRSENTSNVFDHTTPEEFENATTTGHFGFVVEETRSWKSRDIMMSSFRKAPFSIFFPSTQKRKASVFKFLRFEERLQNAPFSWRICVDGRSNLRNKAPFSYSFGARTYIIGFRIWSLCFDFRRCVVDVTTTRIGETRCSQKETCRLFPIVAVKNHTVTVERILT